MLVAGFITFMSCNTKTATDEIEKTKQDSIAKTDSISALIKSDSTVKVDTAKVDSAKVVKAKKK